MDWNTDEVTTEEKPAAVKDVTIKELEEKCAQIAAKRAEVDVAKDALKVIQTALDQLESELVATLEGLGRTSFDSTKGRFGISYRSSVRIPAGDDRARFFDYLRSIDEFEPLITVNSQTLNSWYKQKMEMAKEAGNLLDFSIPGIQAPTLSPTLSFTKKK